MNNSVPTGSPEQLHIGISGFSYHDLYDPIRLRDLAQHFYTALQTTDHHLWTKFNHYRQTLGEGMKPEERSEIVVSVAPHLSAFITELFQVQNEHGRLRRIVEDDTVVLTFKREFVVRRALKHVTKLDDIDTATVLAAIEVLNNTLFLETFAQTDMERALALSVIRLIDLEKSFKHAELHDEQPSAELIAEVATLRQLVAEAIRHSPAVAAQLAETASLDDDHTFITGVLAVYERWVAIQHRQKRPETRGWASLKIPHNVNFAHLVHLEPAADKPEGAYVGPREHYRFRDGFKLTDHRATAREILGEVEYCIYCHNRDKDSCSKGLRAKDGTIQKNPLGITLNGCPLDEKISEAHTLKGSGDGLAAFAVVMVDNPMCPGTGHRICNDCMKACIYQKQEPVNIPQIETSLLTEVLNYPFGFEIYSLLTRWNPLNVRRPYALPYNGKKVLVVGLGPAGYTLSHYLINEGFGVIGVDGLKIEPLPERWVGSKGNPPQPIRDYHELIDQLDERILLGFGGVSEYGITVRWDKNFLKVIYIALARRRNFRIYGGIRFGGTITIDDAWNMGFDHIAIATGAGKPTMVPMKNNLLRGIRQASDFLMALQLTGAFKRDALANLEVRLPAVVIGGGLTGIDTATEVMAYYPIQVERLARRVDILVAELGETQFWSGFNEEERETLHEMLEHGHALQQERETAAQEGRDPNFIDLIRSWGGVSLVYRKTVNDSPAYRLNHEEIAEALEEGIYFIENMSPTAAISDKHGAVEGMVFEQQGVDENGKWRSTGKQFTIPARTVLIAAGTAPNTIIERENPGTFAYDEWRQYFAPHRVEVATTIAAEAEETV